MEVTGYIYLGGDEMIAGYLVGWEYPINYQAEEQDATTQVLAELFPEHFESIDTPFPDPNRPRPPRK